MGRSHSSSSQGFWTWLRFCGGQSGEQTCIHRPGFVQRALSVKNQEKAFPSVATMFEAHYVLWEISLCTVALRAPLIPVCTYSYLFPTLPLKTLLEFTHDEDVESSWLSEHKEDFMPFAVFYYLESCRFEMKWERECREKLEEWGRAGGREIVTERMNLKIHWISSVLCPQIIFFSIYLSKIEKWSISSSVREDY